MADYDGDGTADIGIFRPTDGVWYMSQSTEGLLGVKFGQDGDLPVQGDYNGDGRADVAVYRPSTSYWYIDDPAIDYYFFKWGVPSDIPVSADYDGDISTPRALAN